jgi:hypothetical protein
MTPNAAIRERETVITRIAGSEEKMAVLWEHLREIEEGMAFRGSSRCARFLTYIVEQAVAGRFDSLKERVIGVEVFGRSPDYDTSEDAIVRVTASDVRKRLLQHYGRNGSASRFQISLPVGSYIPEIICEAPKPGVRSRLAVSQGFASQVADAPATDSTAAPVLARNENNSGTIAAIETAASKWRIIAFSLAALLVALLGLNLALWGTVWKKLGPAKAAQNPALLWSALLSSTRPTHLITSDIDFVKIQRLLGRRISVSDYANRSYIPALNTLSPELKRIYLTTMPGDKAPLLDTRIVAHIAEMAKDSSGRIDVLGARSLQFPDLKSDDNFIFLGSPYSDPWFMVFNDQLDFRIQSHGDKDLGPEFISNVRPGPREQPVYSATAIGGATGETWGILALVENPNEHGQVLLIAGISGEGTQAAGELATDLPSLSAALQKCGIPPSSPLTHFEMLLHIKIMAGYPSQYEVAACHILANAPLALERSPS